MCKGPCKARSLALAFMSRIHGALLAMRRRMLCRGHHVPNRSGPATFRGRKQATNMTHCTSLFHRCRVSGPFILVLLAASSVNVRAQDFEPRQYPNAPNRLNINAAGTALTRLGYPLDPPVP